MPVGPVEYLVIRFPGDRLREEMAPAIRDLVERGQVRILDLVFVKKDAQGAVVSWEFDELDEGASFASIEGDAGDVLGGPDIDQIAASLPPGCIAAVLVWEDLWAADLARVVQAAGGQIVDGHLLSTLAVEQAMSSAIAQEAQS